ncbi:MAG: ATPase P [Lentisphaerae bacterium]|nr:ATPase P [Lentisphaerota bacterium]
MKPLPSPVIARPGHKPIRLEALVCDFTGTLSLDGKLLPGVAAALRLLARRLRLIVATADTFGTARKALAGLPVELHPIKTGRDKARLVAELGAKQVAAIGNGHNDVAMARKAALSIAVIGPEGAAGALVEEADIVVRDVREALSLLLHPLRLTATLRD